VRSFLTPWPWLTIAAAMLAITVGTLAWAAPVVCAELVLHEDRIECYLSDIAASQVALTGASTFLADAGPTVGVLGAAMVAVLITRWIGHG